MRGERFQAGWESLADFTTLQQLKPANVTNSVLFKQVGTEIVGHVELSNPGDTIAFLVHARVRRGIGGDEVTPSYWDDNYVLLMPREKKRLTVRFPIKELGGRKPVLEAAWWNPAKVAGANSGAQTSR